MQEGMSLKPKTLELRTNLDKQGKWSDVISIDLAETFTKIAV
jgi:hypothetical protein